MCRYANATVAAMCVSSSHVAGWGTCCSLDQLICVKFKYGEALHKGYGVEGGIASCPARSVCWLRMRSRESKRARCNATPNDSGFPCAFHCAVNAESHLLDGL